MRGYPLPHLENKGFAAPSCVSSCKQRYLIVKVLQTNGLTAVCERLCTASSEMGNDASGCQGATNRPAMAGRRSMETQLPLPHNVCFNESAVGAIGRTTQRHVISRGRGTVPSSTAGRPTTPSARVCRRGSRRSSHSGSDRAYSLSLGRPAFVDSRNCCWREGDFTTRNLR